VARHWDLAPARLSYLPVGWGDHHWELADAAGRRWFVTVAALAGGWRGTGAAAGYADLRAVLDTVLALTRAGLEFAVPPVPAVDGRALARLGAEHAITLFPYLDGTSGGELSPPDRTVLIGMLARLHGATPLAARTAPARRPGLAARPVLEAALGELSERWAGGPYSEPARDFLTRHAAPLRQILAHFDELAREVARGGPPVFTHGEPKPDNVLRAGGRLRLIDWDTAGLAWPERDLWLAAGTDLELADHYAGLSGRRVSAAAMRLYQLRWLLDDITLSLSGFRGPHGRDDDTELSWTVLTGQTEALLQAAS
jgi:spectinomycin phosphotransferase